MIAVDPIGGTGARIDQQALGLGLRLDPRGEISRCRKRRLGPAIGDDLDGPEQSAAADVADMGMLLEACDQELLELAALLTHPRNEVFAVDRIQYGQCPRAGRSVAHIGMAVPEIAGTG